MEFTNISEKAFRSFAKKSPYRSFMQTPEIAAMRQKSGWQAEYFAVKQGKTILAASLVLHKPTFMGYQTYYAPGGPLLDLENRELLDFFVENLRKHAKAQKGYVLRIDPYYELIERDIDGKIVENGFDHRNALKNLKNLGFKPAPSSQPKYLFATDTTQKIPADELLKQIKRHSRNTFRNIQKAEKMGVKIRELSREELNILKDITESTGERRSFDSPPLEYYQNLYDLFYPSGEAKFLVAEAEIDGKMTPLSAVSFILYGSEVISLFGGNLSAYLRSHSAQYLLQWYMLKYALEHPFTRYNFYGIQGLPDPKSPDYGIYNFKRGFGGQVIELIGTFELPLNPTIYHLHSALSSLKHLIHH